MERFKTDARTGLRHELQGDYYLIAGEDEADGGSRRHYGTNESRKSDGMGQTDEQYQDQSGRNH